MCSYDEVHTNDNAKNKNNEDISNKYFWRQLLISSGVWTVYYIHGLNFGAPTIYIHQIRDDPNSTITFTDNMAAWISSVGGYSSLPMVLVFIVLTKLFGTKVPYMFVCISLLVCFIIYYFSTSAIQFLISQMVDGTVIASMHTFLPLIITEYSSPRYRGIFLAIKSATFYWGVWTSNAIGTFVHWKYIGILAFVCSIYTLTTFFLWPQSPYWLVSKKQIEKCAKTHRWLKGVHKDEEKELHAMINSKCIDNDEISFSRDGIVMFFKTFSLPQFYKPTLLCILVMLLYHLTGKLACTMYAIDIIMKITKNKSDAYRGMLILDGVTVFSMYFGCFLLKTIKRRTLLIFATSISICFLFLMSLYLYLIKLSIIVEVQAVSFTLLSLFSVTVSCGPIILSTTIYSEIVPVKYKCTSFLVIGLCAGAVMTAVLITSPSLFQNLGLHGAFLFYAISSSICLYVLYLFLPETKDRTIGDIEKCFIITNNTMEEAVELVTIKR